MKKFQPKQLFLIDSVGALISAIMLGLVLTTFEEWFGMPSRALYLLALLAGLFFLYSYSRYRINSERWRPYLKVIAIINLLYCFLTLNLVVYFYSSLTVLGLVYFVGEIVIILALAVIELKTAARPIDQDQFSN